MFFETTRLKTPHDLKQRMPIVSRQEKQKPLAMWGMRANHEGPSEPIHTQLTQAEDLGDEEVEANPYGSRRPLIFQ